MISQKRYTLPPCNRAEILRYAGAHGQAESLDALLTQCLAECEALFPEGRVCFCTVPVSVAEHTVVFPFASVESASLAKHLSHCTEAVLFAATVGILLDRCLEKYSRTAVSKALLLQAIGTERIEALCDCFCADTAEAAAQAGKFTRPRFSPGYGDLPLAFQRDMFRLLDCPRQIGLTLNESLLMSPSKSVTAILGLGSSACRAEKSGCETCAWSECSFRKDP